MTYLAIYIGNGRLIVFEEQKDGDIKCLGARGERSLRKIYGTRAVLVLEAIGREAHKLSNNPGTKGKKPEDYIFRLDPHPSGFTLASDEQADKIRARFATEIGRILHDVQSSLSIYHQEGWYDHP